MTAQRAEAQLRFINFDLGDARFNFLASTPNGAKSTMIVAKNNLWSVEGSVGELRFKGEMTPELEKKLAEAKDLVCQRCRQTGKVYRCPKCLMTTAS